MNDTMFSLSGLLPSSEEMSHMDKRTIEAGTPASVLMERAGARIAQFILDNFISKSPRAKVLVLCGPGNNGGDGVVINRILKESAVQSVTVSVLSQRRVPDISDDDFHRLFHESDLIVDCLLGTGQSGPPRGAIKDLVILLEQERSLYQKTVISVDLPTGVNASTGVVYEPAIKADLTVCIQCVKRGLLQYPAATYAGKIECVDIGIDTRGGALFRVFSPMAGLPRRSLDAHKGNFGRVLVLAGSQGMPGAPLLASHAALRAGAPLVSRGWGEKLRAYSQMPEVINVIVPLGAAGVFGKAALKAITPRLSEHTVIVLGPGLTVSGETKAFVKGVLAAAKKKNCRVVLDADGLNCLGSLKSSIDLSHCVITPHPGEAARLLGATSLEIQSDRYNFAIELYERTGAIIVLKGASTVVFGLTTGVVNTTGNPFMATGGSGDVLCGVIAALLSQGLSSFDAAQWGVYLHGRAGDMAHSVHGGPIVASDIIDFLPQVLGEVIDVAS